MTHLRQIAPFRRRARKASVEALTERIAQLTAERQGLRASGAAASKLERNRVQLCRAQWELSHALIERYLPQPAAQPVAEAAA